MDRIETAQLQRDIVGAVTHDLGSIAGALALRAELGGSADAERQKAILKTLADQVRTAMRMLEVVRGGGDRSELGGVSSAPSGWWLEQLARLVTATLPRGSNGQVMGAGHAPPLMDRQVATLSMLALASVRHLQSGTGEGPVVFELLLERAPSIAPATNAASPGSHDEMAVSLVVRNGPATRGRPLRLRAGRSRWQRYADALCTETGWSIIWWRPYGDEGFIWRCLLPLSAPG